QPASCLVRRARGDGAARGGAQGVGDAQAEGVVADVGGEVDGAAAVFEGVGERLLDDAVGLPGDQGGYGRQIAYVLASCGAAGAHQGVQVRERGPGCPVVALAQDAEDVVQVLQGRPGGLLDRPQRRLGRAGVAVEDPARGGGLEGDDAERVPDRDPG